MCGQALTDTRSLRLDPKIDPTSVPVPVPINGNWIYVSFGVVDSFRPFSLAWQLRGVWGVLGHRSSHPKASTLSIGHSELANPSCLGSGRLSPSLTSLILADQSWEKFPAVKAKTYNTSVRGTDEAIVQTVRLWFHLSHIFPVHPDQRSQTRRHTKAQQQ